MKEIEVKFRVKNFSGIAANIRKLGAKLLWSGKEENFYFDTIKMALKKEGGALRLRAWGGHSNALTLKDKLPSKRYKMVNEYQIEISDLKTAKQILEHLGFKVWLHYFKNRSHWKLGNIYIEFDSLNGKNFVEIEGPKKKIELLAKKLGLDWKTATTKDYSEISKEK